MTVEAGDYLVMPYPDGGEIYRISNSVLATTYALDRTHMGDDAEEVPSQIAVLKVWSSVLRRDGAIFKKATKVHAMRASDHGTLDTIVDGAIESRSEYEIGDVIIANPEGERYTMSWVEFAARYDVSSPAPASDGSLADEGFQLYQATNQILALKLTAEQVEAYFPALSFVARQVPSFSHAMCPVNVLTNPRFAVGGRR